MPLLEDRFIADNINLQVENMILDGKHKIQPLISKNKGNFRASRFLASNFCTFSIPLKKEWRGSRTVSVSGSVEFTAYEQRDVSSRLTGKETQEALPNGATLVVKIDGKNLTVQLSGKGPLLRQWLSGKRLVTCFDAEGNPQESNLGRNSTSSSGDGWRIELSGSVTNAVARLTVRVPFELPKMTLPFTLRDIPLPLTGE